MGFRRWIKVGSKILVHLLLLYKCLRGWNGFKMFMGKGIKYQKQKKKRKKNQQYYNELVISIAYS